MHVHQGILAQDSVADMRCEVRFGEHCARVAVALAEPEEGLLDRRVLRFLLLLGRVMLFLLLR
jgi:hypothetical protein